MKAFNLLVLTVIVLSFSSCGKENKKTENITRESIIGKWQPQKIEFRDIPKFIEKQVEKENLEKLLDEDQKQGFLELKDDSEFVYQDTQSSNGVTGQWTFEGKTIKIEVYDTSMAFHILSVSKDEMEIDYASFYKAMMGVEKISIPFGNVKMVMVYKRIK